MAKIDFNQIDQAAVQACGGLGSLPVELHAYHGAHGLMLKIDNNFKLFFIPHPKTLDYVLLGPNNKHVTRGLVINTGGKTTSFQKAILACEEYMSTVGTTLTYGSINLKTISGVNRATCP